MSTTLTIREEKQVQLKAFIESGKFKEQLQVALPRHLTADRFARITLTAINRNPNLLSCTRESLGLAILQSAAIGLEPDGRNAHLVPFGEVATLIIDYKGIVSLVRRSGEVADIHADLVCENDEFSYVYGSGSHLRHKPARRDRGEPLDVYSYVRFKDGSESFLVMSVDEINHVRDNFSQGYRRAVQNRKTDHPWMTSWEAMAQKTCFKRHSKWLPLSSDLLDALRADDDADALPGNNYTNVTPTDKRPTVPEKQKGVAAMRSLENQQQPQSQPESSDAFEEPPPPPPPPDPEPVKEVAKPSGARRPGRPPKERAENPAADPQSETAPSSGSSPEYSAPVGNKEAAGSAALGSVTAPAASTPEANEARPWPRTGVVSIKVPNDGIVTKNPALGFKEHTLPDSGEVVRLIKRCVIESTIFNGTAFYTGRDPAIVELLDSGDAIEVTLSLQPNANANRPPNVIIESAARLGETTEI